MASTETLADNTAQQARARVLVAENIGESGLDVLAVAGFDVELGYDWTRDELEQRIDGYDAIVIRSATQVDAALIERATRLRAVARAGVGVDNVDVHAATKRGIIVVNAPRSNVVTAAEHTMAVAALAAHHAGARRASGRPLDRKFQRIGVDKPLGIIGSGRPLVGPREASACASCVDQFVATELYET